MDLHWSQVQVTVMASYGIIFLSKKLTHIFFSELRSINAYLVIDGVDMTAGLVVTPCSRWVLVCLGVQSQSCTIVSAPG